MNVSIKQITDGELLVLEDTLRRMQNEIDSINNNPYSDYIFNSGVEEGIDESLKIVESLLGEYIE